MKDLQNFEDTVRLKKTEGGKENQYSPYCDFIHYKSSRDPSLTLAMKVLKPAKPSYIVATTHGWHMSISPFSPCETPQSSYLSVAVDMRGRAFSDGKADCNGWELYDIIDAIEYVKKSYAEYIIDPDVVYFDAGSGGGGNGYALAGKFPDYFAHITVLSGMSDYGMWHDENTKGDFRDELDVWIGDRKNNSAYRSRSGYHLLPNLCSPISIAHGETDPRVPCSHARKYVQYAKELGKESLVKYLELEGVGTAAHFGNATKEQMEQLDEFRKTEKTKYRTPVSIPRKGEMVVGGYLFTKEFSIVLPSIDDIALLKYDLDKNSFELSEY